MHTREYLYVHIRFKVHTDGYMKCTQGNIYTYMRFKVHIDGYMKCTQQGSHPPSLFPFTKSVFNPSRQATPNLPSPFRHLVKKTMDKQIHTPNEEEVEERRRRRR